MAQKNFLIDVLNNYEVDETTGCWLYLGNIDSHVGYGRVMISGHVYHVHRLAAFFYLGLDLSDNNQFACHIRECPNRSCINYNHLYIGDNQSNQLDVIKDKCKRGHDLIGNNVRISYRKNGMIFRQCKICEKMRYEIRKDATAELIRNLNRKER